jgi:hypothetical protein
MTITTATADDWLKKYGQAWEERAPHMAAQLFAEDCRYYETPFSEPQIGRDGVLKYWQAVPEGQIDVAFHYGVLSVQSHIVIAHWSASFTRISSRVRVRLDGVFLLEFNDQGLCSTLREWWHRDETPQL